MSRHNSKSGLFLMEMIIVILFFSICAAICVNVFAKARVTSDSSRELNNAAIRSSNIAEVYKAADGDLQQTAALLNELSGEDLQTAEAESETADKVGTLTVEYDDMTAELTVGDDGLAEINTYSAEKNAPAGHAEKSIFTMHVRA